MRILCLHGRHQDGEGFKSELASALSGLEPSTPGLAFDFVDGPLPSSKSPAGGTPQYTFYETGTVKSIRKAHEWLGQNIGLGGPYDGVIAFSQGAALISSYMLYRQWYDHDSPPPFRFAIFISGSISLRVLRDLGMPISREAERVVAEAELQNAQGLGPVPDHVAKARRAVWNSDDCFGLDLNRIPLELKIRIPSVHIWGEGDPLLPMSIHLAGLCDPYIRRIHTHPGAHEVPRGESESAQLVHLLQWCIQRAVWPGHTQVEEEMRRSAQ